VPKFTDNKIDRAYENFMKQIPGFQRDPPEAKTIQKDIQKKIKKCGRRALLVVVWLYKPRRMVCLLCKRCAQELNHIVVQLYQCGYIDRGIIPKFAGCGNGVDWFKSKGQWLDGSATPESGNIIFFDWVEDGIQDGNSDHVGIVEKAEGGRVYTIEGNSGDAYQQNSYPIGYFESLGYGTANLF